MQQIENLPCRDTLVSWTWILSRAINNGLLGLSMMTGKNIQPDSINIIWKPSSSSQNIITPYSELTYSVQLSIEGDATGLMMLTCGEQCAYTVIDDLLGHAHGTTIILDDMGRSILGEMGNITGSFFLNELADRTGRTLMPSPPSIKMIPKGSPFFDELAATAAFDQTQLLIKTTYTAIDADLSGSFIVLPAVQLMNSIMNDTLLHPG